MSLPDCASWICAGVRERLAVALPRVQRPRRCRRCERNPRQHPGAAAGGAGGCCQPTCGRQQCHRAAAGHWADRCCCCQILPALYCHGQPHAHAAWRWAGCLLCTLPSLPNQKLNPPQDTAAFPPPYFAAPGSLPNLDFGMIEGLLYLKPGSELQLENINASGALRQRPCLCLTGQPICITVGFSVQGPVQPHYPSFLLLPTPACRQRQQAGGLLAREHAQPHRHPVDAVVANSMGRRGRQGGWPQPPSFQASRLAGCWDVGVGCDPLKLHATCPCPGGLLAGFGEGVAVNHSLSPALR